MNRSRSRERVELTKEFVDKVEDGTITLVLGAAVKRKHRTENLQNLDVLVAFLRGEHRDVAVVRSNDTYLLLPERAARHMDEAQKRVRQHAAVSRSGPSKFWAGVPEIIAVFPEVESEFSSALTKIGEATCSSCQANSLKRNLEARIAEIHIKNPDRDIPKDLLLILGPAFAQAVARSKYKEAVAGSMATPVSGGTHRLMQPRLHTHGTLGVRPTCLDCVRKHIGQAIVLFLESDQTYPAHFWLGIGHLAEASDEALASYPALAQTLREYRLSMMEDPGYKPNLIEFFAEIDALAEDVDPLIKDISPVPGIVKGE